MTCLKCCARGMSEVPGAKRSVYYKDVRENLTTCGLSVFQGPKSCVCQNVMVSCALGKE